VAEPLGTVEVDWHCETCHTVVHITRPIQYGVSAAEQAAANSDDLEAVKKRHSHTGGDK
jgi:hypothetical protein